MKQLIFTDLDGTLLDEKYRYDVSRPAVQWLKSLNFPVIFCSSKTFAEQEFYRTALDISAPFIVENGNAVFITKHYFTVPVNAQRETADFLVIELGKPVAEIRATLANIRSETGIGFKCYCDLSVAEICAITGLDKAAAKCAATRDYSETILTPLTETEQQTIRDALKPFGLVAVSGGRFFTVTSATADKGTAVRLLAEIFRQQFGEVHTVSLGDSANDVSLLAATDVAFLVQKQDGTWQDIALPNLHKINGIGPKGWVIAMEIFQKQLLSKLR